MLFKTMTHFIWMPLQKFVILATSVTATVGLKPTLDFIANATKQDTLKKLCRFIQDSLKQQEECEDVIVYFRDYQNNQLYSIVFAEDDDFVNNFIHALKQQ